ncbi:RHS repeat-associated core domain-containing protein [Acinetobacter baumannii]|uniref:RHS repeat-associated core domain-containing protein n=1 Tax=Acinetobacter baumannii TaxID=470 RepID=UPI000810BBAC|nr:RHS repeat-associated core domain-containing protein [Acinetobacter baumannii]MCT9370451.1 RHS domain-containing protein [Acinetobacter baumannii]MCT9560959.1 RHS domain-containing protein [Acinetobacter baumannii]MDC4620846.1 RHS domain-containing protein [Acinetobacter baumannii]MDC5157660.1 RHS domain-containing protein [Acinetobacter baumannii]MDC5463820.1 RHS domain-containing protein [Acinetobacter baumannii]
MAKENTQQKEIKKQPAVELAVFNLNSVTDVADLQMIASQVQLYLQVCGNTTLEQIKIKANITTVANIFALTGSVLDLMLYATDKKTGDAAVQRGALLAANLIGLFSEPNNEAHARMALRPMFGLMAECLYRENGKIKETDIKRLGLHLNAMIAGDLENFLKETQAKLSSLLTSATTLGVTILQSMATPATGINAGITTAAGASAEKRDPKLKFTNWAVPLIDLLGKPSQANLTPKIQPNITSRLQQEATQAIAALSQTLQQQANAGQKYTLAWLLQETLKAIQALENKGNASVPVNQTGEYERHTKGDTLEFVSLQADALNAPPCEGADSQSGKSISYSIGAERVQHADFYLPKIGFSFIRQYNSQMDEFDQSMVGARWMMPFSNMIQRTAQGYLFIDSKGRKHQLPASITFETYEVPYEGIIVQPLKNGDLVLNFGGDWTFQFHQFSVGQPYQLIQQFNEKTQEKIDLSYLIFEKVAYLQCVNFQLEHAKHQLKFAFNEQVKIMAVFLDDNAEPLARYDYDTQGNLIKAIDQNGHTRTYEYNYFHQLTRYTDRTGRGQNIRYESTDAKAKAIEEWADDGSFHTKLKWHPRLRQVAVYDAYDVPTYYYFDLNGFTYRTRLADGRESWYSRDGKKRITRQIDFEGRETQQEYNDQDQLVKIVQPNGGVIRFAYDEQDNLVEIKDPEGSIWKREYDENGNLNKEINPLGHITQYKYNNDNQLVEVVDAKGGVKKIQYNELGQMISYTDCSGKSSTWEYDEDGVLTAEQTANNKVVQYFYSTKGRDKGQLQSIIYPDGLKEYFEHDEEGRLLKHTDTKGLVTEYKYNQVGLLEQRIDANRHSVAYQWDKQGRIQKLINQNQAEYLFGYNPYGYLIREQAFDGEEKHYSYNENGRIFQIRQPNILTQFDYYADGQIASKSFTHLHTGQKQTEQFDYNLNSQLSRASNEVSQIDFYRNALGQLVREHQHYKIPELKPLTAVLRYEYDELGNLIKTIRPDGQTLNHLVYGSGHIYAIGLNNQEVVSFQRDDLHRETTRLLANGLIQTKQYNDVGLLSSQLIQPEQETQDYLQYQAHRYYQYDQNYLLSQVEDSRLGKLNYQYDPIGRLIAAQSLHKAESFSFDPAGNLIDTDSVLSPAQIKNNLIKSYKGKHYQYDAQGNVTEIIQAGKNLKLTWDNQNRLIRSDNNGLVTEYGYDVFGRRLYKKISNELTLFGWDGDLMIWESFKSAQTNYTKHYIYEPDSFVPLLQAGYKDFIQLIETPDYQEYQTKPYSIYKDPVWNRNLGKERTALEQFTFYHCDQVGTPQTMTNIRGECVWEILQDTWGAVSQIKALNQDNPFEQNNLRFQGQYYDQETELHYNRYRYYEPHSARYVSKDPIGLEGGMNTSSYVSDPNQWIDPKGLNSFNYGEMFGIPASAQSGLAYQGQRNYECYAETGELCKIKVPPLFDYVACSGGGLGIGVGFVKNQWTGEYYISGSKDSLLIPVAKSVAQNKQFSAKDLAGASCVGGNIHNIPSYTKTTMTMGEITNEFVSGASVTVGGGAYGAVANVVVPLVSKSSPVKGTWASELGVGTPGFNVGVSGTVSVDTILDAVKPSKK